jgi:hypothetical protein
MVTYVPRVSSTDTFAQARMAQVVHRGWIVRDVTGTSIGAPSAAGRGQTGAKLNGHDGRKKRSGGGRMTSKFDCTVADHMSWLLSVGLGHNSERHRSSASA